MLETLDKHTIIRCLTLALFCAVLFAPFTWAEKTYRIGVEAQNYAPFSYVENHEFRGLFREVLDKFAQEYHLTFQYDVYPISRLYSVLSRGQIDAKFPDHPDWAPSKKQSMTVSYSNEGIPAINGVMTRVQDKDRQPGEIKNVGTVLGFTMLELESMAKDQTIVINEVPRLDNLLRMLEKHHVRGIYFDSNVAYYYMRKGSGLKLALNKHFPYTQFTYRLSTVNHPKLTKLFDDFLLKHQKWFRKTLRKHNILPSEVK